MPTELWVALIGAAAVAVGYFLRPLGELAGDTLRHRREQRDRSDRFQFETLVEIQTSLETVRLGGRVNVPKVIDQAEERLRTLAFLVRDDELRERLVNLNKTAARDEMWVALYDDALERLGEVLRAM